MLSFSVKDMDGKVHTIKTNPYDEFALAEAIMSYMPNVFEIVLSNTEADWWKACYIDGEWTETLNTHLNIHKRANSHIKRMRKHNQDYPNALF